MHHAEYCLSQNLCTRDFTFGCDQGTVHGARVRDDAEAAARRGHTLSCFCSEGFGASHHTHPYARHGPLIVQSKEDMDDALLEEWENDSGGDGSISLKACHPCIARLSPCTLYSSLPHSYKSQEFTDCMFQLADLWVTSTSELEALCQDPAGV